MRAVALAVVLAACGSHDATSSTSGSQAPAPAPARSDAAPAPVVAIAIDAHDDAHDLAVQIGRVRDDSREPPGDFPPPPRSGNEPVGPAPVTGRVVVSDKQAFDETTLSPDQVHAKIQQVYFAGLKRCYKDTLKRDPTARGKVAMKFTVNATGILASPRVDGFDTALDQCIQTQMERWRFSAPKDHDGDPTEAAFQINLQLVPE